MKQGDFQNDDQQLIDLFQRSESAPGKDLKEKIMQEITIKKEVFEYQPVISKKTWIILASCFVVLMAYLFNYEGKSGFTFIKMDRFTNFLNRDIPSGFFHSFQLSLPDIPSSFNTAIIALIVFGIYFIISLKFGMRLPGAQ